MDEITLRIRRIVAESFGVEAATLGESTTARDVEGWDSLAHATLILRLQKAFGVVLDPAESAAAQDLGALGALIARARGRHG